MLACGLRVTEAANLKPEDVVLQQGRVFLMVRHGKGNKERMVPVTDADVARELIAFAQTKQPGDNLFGVQAGTFKWHAREIRKATVVQEVLGHENINTTRRYAKTAPERLCQLAPKVE